MTWEQRHAERRQEALLADPPIYAQLAAQFRREGRAVPGERGRHTRPPAPTHLPVLVPLGDAAVPLRC
ncbi:hypothetical protein ACIRBX_24725 [Kitasatospora sp. NPDC096147]|uniref:hypothetical protein n=1 Tax=Kitasatospora sp. NPDC096147 TaxID=3364093 RepID=UPI003809CDB7